MLELTVDGKIPVKKNRQRIGAHGGIYKAPEVAEYEELFGWQARIARCQPVEGSFSISGTFRLRDPKDLDGALTTVLDCLQKLGLIENDKKLVLIKDLEKVIVKKPEEEGVTFRIEKSPARGSAG